MRGRWLNAAGAALVAAVTAAVIGALMVAGSPAQARMERADQERSNRLEMVYQAIRSHYDLNKKLPASLGELEPDIAFAMDPVSREPFAYRAIDKDRFEICAVFETDTRSEERVRYYDYGGRNFSRHDKGRTCFAFPAKGR